MLAVAAGRSLTIYGNGKQVRDLLFVDDLVRAFRLAALHIDTTAGNVYNIGGGRANSVSIWHELRPRLEQLASKPLHTKLDEWRPGDQPVYVSDTRRAQRDFSWQPVVDVDEGLRRLWDWARDLNGAPTRIARKPRPTPLHLPLTQPNVAYTAGKPRFSVGPSA
jgi:CDP-paratose 2-epimerase